MKQARVLILLIVLAGLVWVAPSARAALNENYCFPTFTPDRCISLMQWVENWVARGLTGAAIWLLKGMAQVAWLLDRASAFIYSKSILDNAWLLNLKEQMSSLFASMMPGMLQSVAFGSGGLMYVAFAIAGLLMMIPFWGAGARFVRPERVMIWGALLSVLFVVGTFGYDFISGIESYRQTLVGGIVQGSGMPLDNMIQQPMLAGSGDLGFGGDLMALPPMFDSTYFPTPELLEVTISEGGGFGFGNALIEPEYRIQERLVLSQQGGFYAVVSLFGAWLLILTGVTYVLLSFTSLILIVFIFAALPLGFFEIGGQILLDLAGRYFQVVIFSLTLAIFLRWMSSSLGYIVDVNSVDNSLLWIVVVVVMIVVTGAFMKGSLNLLIQSPKAMSGTLSVFNGPSLGQTVNNTTSRASEGAGRFIAQTAGMVSAGALLAGRPEVAMVANAVGSLTSRPGSAAPREEMPRGNVFVGNGAAGRPVSSVGAGNENPVITNPVVQPAMSTQPPSVPQSQPPQPAQSPLPQEALPQAVLQAISARQGWGEVQMQQVREAAAGTGNTDEAVQRLQTAPGFERTNNEELRKAVEAAKVMK